MYPIVRHSLLYVIDCSLWDLWFEHRILFSSHTVSVQAKATIGAEKGLLAGLKATNPVGSVQPVNSIMGQRPTMFQQRDQRPTSFSTMLSHGIPQYHLPASKFGRSLPQSPDPEGLETAQLPAGGQGHHRSPSVGTLKLEEAAATSGRSSNQTLSQFRVPAPKSAHIQSAQMDPLLKQQISRSPELLMSRMTRGQHLAAEVCESRWVADVHEMISRTQDLQDIKIEWKSNVRTRTNQENRMMVILW